ncbi:putative lipoprotein [Leptospira interrogans str. UI 13372]|nr:putative lipoprotein [Leptospira interrogans str. UI 13372]
MNTFNKYALYYLKSKTQHLNPKSFWGSFLFIACLKTIQCGNY